MTGSARYMQVCCNISGTFVHLVVPWMSVDISVYLGTTRLQFSYKTSITLRSQTRHQQEDHRFPGRWTSSYMNLLMAITWYQHACVSGKSHITWNVHSNIFSCFTEFAFVALNQQYSSFMHCFNMLTVVLGWQKHTGRQKHHRLKPVKHQFDRYLGFHWRSYVIPPSLWWCQQMETFSALLFLCEGNSPVPSQRLVTGSSDVFFYLRLHKRLSKQLRCGRLRRHLTHYDVTVISESLLILEAHNSRLSIYVNGQNCRNQGRSQCGCTDILISTLDFTMESSRFRSFYNTEAAISLRRTNKCTSVISPDFHECGHAMALFFSYRLWSILSS